MGYGFTAITKKEVHGTSGRALYGRPATYTGLLGAGRASSDHRVVELSEAEMINQVA